MSTSNPSTSLHSSSMGQGNRDSAAAGEDLRSKATNVKQSVAELGSVAKQAAGEKLTELRDSAGEKLTELRDTATDYYERGRDRVYEAEQSMEDYIRQQPVKSVLIAAGVGFLFGACYLRR